MSDLLTDEQIVAIRDEHLPSQGEAFDCIAFARAVLAAAEQQITALKKQNDEQAFLMTLASAHRDELEAQIAALRADAERWRWWKHDHIHVARDEPGDWTCWMEMDQIPFRSETTSVDDLTDALIMRFPIDADRAAKPTSERTDRGSS